jgi:hypothetical protein
MFSPAVSTLQEQASQSHQMLGRLWLQMSCSLLLYNNNWSKSLLTVKSETLLSR